MKFSTPSWNFTYYTTLEYGGWGWGMWGVWGVGGVFGALVMGGAYPEED